MHSYRGYIRLQKDLQKQHYSSHGLVWQLSYILLSKIGIILKKKEGKRARHIVVTSRRKLVKGVYISCSSFFGFPKGTTLLVACRSDNAPWVLQLEETLWTVPL